MAIVVEDGTGIENAETYATVAELEAYAAKRGLTLTTNTEANKERLLRLASDYIESKLYRLAGYKSHQRQALAFPRFGIWIDGYEIAGNVIPQRLKDAQIQLAIDIETSNPFVIGDGREVIREKIDVLEVEYSSSGRTAVLPVFSKFEALFRVFYASGGGLQFSRA